MIENEEQHQAALRRLRELEQRLADMLASPGMYGLVHPLVREAEEGNLRGELEGLREAISDYEGRAEG